MTEKNQTDIHTQLKWLVSDYVEDNVEELRSLRGTVDAAIQSLEDLKGRIDAGLEVYDKNYRAGRNRWIPR